MVTPCLNEAETLGICIAKARRVLQEQSINGQVIVADNGSSDGSEEIARSLGVRVVPVADRGYGNALMAGIAAACGSYVVIVGRPQSTLCSAMACFTTFSTRDRSRALDYTYQALKPGGYFAFWENNPWSLGARYLMSRIPFDRDA